MRAETKVMRAIFDKECKDEDLRDPRFLRDTIFRLLQEISEESRLPSFAERVIRVFVLRFGLVDGQCRTLREVGDKFGVTGERIWQIERMGLRYFRHPNYSRVLKSFFVEPGRVLIKIDRTFDEGYVRPLHRGVVLGDEYLERIIEEAIPDGCYSRSGGSMLKGIHICIEVEEAKKGVTNGDKNYPGRLGLNHLRYTREGQETQE